MNFRSLVSADVWRDLIERGRRRTYPSNAVLLAQGESPDCVIALVDGLVKVVQSNECGDELTVERLHSHERLRADLAHLPCTARVARLVSHLADEVGRPQEETGLMVELGMPREELATMAAMRRSSALAALGELQAAGILTLGRRRLVITDMDRLRAVARGEEPPGGTSRKDATAAM